MKGSETFLLPFMEGAQKYFIIPVYQRKYDWKIDNCRQLYEEANREDCSKIPKARKAHKFSAFGKSLSIRTFAGHRHEPPYLLLYLKMKIIHEIGQAAFSYN